MSQRIIKCVLGFILLFSLYSEYKVVPQSISIISIFIFFGMISILLIFSGVKNIPLSNFVKKSYIYISIFILLGITAVDVGYSYFTSKTSEIPKETEFSKHNFSVNFPNEPKITKLKPNQYWHIGYHFSSQINDNGYIVVYTDQHAELFSKISKDDYLNISLHQISKQFSIELSNLTQFDLQGFTAYKFAMIKENTNVGNGMVCQVNNRLYRVLHVFDNTSSSTLTDSFIDSFKMTKIEKTQTET